MLKFKLMDALLGDGGFATTKYRLNDWFMIYEWLCRKLIESKLGKYEILNRTSSINNSKFEPVADMNEPVERIAYLLKHNMGFWKEDVCPFLKYIGVRNWNDLRKVITIDGRRPKNFPNRDWFEMQGRTLNYSPNDCHKNARWVGGITVQFCHYSKRWRVIIDYGYPHDSGWELTLEQKYGEHLDSFAKRIEIWLNSILTPDDWPHGRQCDNRTWGNIFSCWKEIFHGDLNMLWDGADEMADLLTKLKGHHKIKLTKRRLSTLKKWAKQSKDE